MIIVSGTKRSGTSAWMHVLATAGVPVVGERFPLDWAQTIGGGNPDGFYESRLVHGVYFRTNPDPTTGAYLRPEQVERHAVKVFIPGLLRSDLAFIDRVLVTVREWRAYCRSMIGLYESAEDAVRHDAETMGAEAMPPALQWWTQNFALIRDAVTRGYPLHVVSLQRLVDAPSETLAEALPWLGLEPSPGLVELIRSGTTNRPEAVRTDPAAEVPEGVADRHVQIFDELYATMHEGRPLTASFVETLNQTDVELRPTIVEYVAQARLHAARLLIDSEGT